MAGILVFVEQRSGDIRAASLQAISEARRHGATVTAILGGSGVGDGAGSLGGYGAEKVFVADDSSLELYSAEGYAEAVVKASLDADGETGARVDARVNAGGACFYCNAPV